MGQLYSRCIGVLSSKGNYIFPLDNDDMFSIKDTVYYVYNLCLLHAYCIKASFYKKVINLYPKNRLYEHITIYEDCIINYIMHQYAQSCELFVKIGYLYIYRASSSSHSELYINKMKCKLFYLETILKYSIISFQNKLLAIQDLMNLIEKTKFKELLKNTKIKTFIESLIQIITRDKSISNNSIIKSLNDLFYNRTS